MRLAVLLWVTGCNGNFCWSEQCVDEPIDVVEDLSCPPEIGWKTVGKPFLDTWCTSCHAATLDPNDRMGAPQGIDFDTWEGASLWADRIVAVTQGQEATMPPAGGPSDEEREAIAAWVACGAPGSATEAGLCDTPRAVDNDVHVTSPSDGESLCAQGDGLRITGDLKVSAASDAMPSCVCEVDGDLTVEGLSTPTVRWSSLHRVGGDLTLADNSGTRDVDFPALKHIEGSLHITRNASAERMDLPNLQTIGGDVQVTDGGTGGGFTASRLATVTGGIVIESNPQLLQIDLVRLRTTGGDLRIIDNVALADIGTLDTLTRIGGGFAFTGSALRDFTGLRYVTELGGDLTLAGHEHLTDIDLLHVLEAIDGTMTLEQMPRLVTLEGMHQLLRVEGDLNVINLGVVDVSGLDSIRQIGGAMTVERMPGLERLTMSTEAVVGGLRIAENESLIGVTAWTHLERVGNLQILDNPALRELRGLQGLFAVDGALAIVDNPQLPDVDGLIGLTEIAGSLTLHNDDALERLSGLQNVGFIGGDLVITDNAALSLTEIDQLLEVIGTDNVAGTILLRSEGEEAPSTEEPDTGL